ncbi:hypothetical protein XM38_022200 [Halomicronema hongdechloris C2206]|uniref:Uncharacterized protein n=1 Tax=Halomicronema hongdechloris C2206 TaxID=1641165 RepID=A0A1Z3HLU8_9CYAN|nr:hypothetical protein [Halomicronema hongdechloris]ASC71268.1 hypothetical protein XM38_022200 [Halomicronema hongdechloris C2206]
MAPPLATRFLVITSLGVLGFGILGLYLPTQARWGRIGHVLAQFLLIFVATAIGQAEFRLFPLLYLILVIRSCFMFALLGRVMVSALAFLMFLVGLHLRLQALRGQVPPQLVGRLQPFLFGMNLNVSILFALLLGFMLLLVNALLAERQGREQLHQVNQELRRSARQGDSTVVGPGS